ncbi:hypothetical protein LJB63_25930, partial [[Eubacterium] rectale]|nr:hypothetical protein [Agathobacter rectalis]
LKKIKGTDRQTINTLRRFRKRHIHDEFPDRANAIPIPLFWQEKSSFVQYDFTRKQASGKRTGFTDISPPPFSKAIFLSHKK